MPPAAATGAAGAIIFASSAAPSAAFWLCDTNTMPTIFFSSFTGKAGNTAGPFFYPYSSMCSAMVRSMYHDDVAPGS